MANLYENDYPLWAHLQAAYLRARQWDKLDINALAEEIDDMGRNERDAVESQVERLLHHLLKWRYQSEQRSGSWRGTIREARFRIAKHIRRAPSLAGYPAEVLNDAYHIARLRAAGETGLDDSAFPATCPWTVEQVLDEQFWPES